MGLGLLLRYRCQLGRLLGRLLGSEPCFEALPTPRLKARPHGPSDHPPSGPRDGSARQDVKQ